MWYDVSWTSIVATLYLGVQVTMTGTVQLPGFAVRIDALAFLNSAPLHQIA